MSAVAWRIDKECVLVDVRLTPNASRDQVEGLDTLADDRVVLKARVRAVPEKGAANAALIKLLSKTCGLPKSSVSLERGSTARIKTLRLDGDPNAVIRALMEVCGL